MNRCPLCGGSKQEGKTTFTVDFGEGVVVVRNVPATICEQSRDNQTELEMIPYKSAAG